MERYIWTAHPYVAFTMVDKLFNPLTLLVGPCLVSYLIFKSTLPVDAGGYHLPWWNILLSYFVWLGATRTFKLLPHLWKSPEHIIYVPAFIIFGYYFAIMKLYALCTLHETGWGTRAGIGDAAAATAALDRQIEEKNNHINNPYRRQTDLEQPPHSGDSPASFPFKSPNDPPPSPYHDEPSQTPIYHYRKHSQHTPRNRSISNRRKRTDEGGVELQTALAR